MDERVQKAWRTEKNTSDRRVLDLHGQEIKTIEIDEIT